MSTPAVLPEVPGTMSAAQVRQTADTIATMQEPDGAIPWSPGEHTDVWNHVEAAMALLVGGRRHECELAMEWVARTQRSDGSWPMKFVAGDIEDHSAETNMCAYFAVGLWHHWLICQDRAVVERYWPIVRRGLDYVCDMQLAFGGIAWSQEWADGEPGHVNAEALLAGSSSIYQSLRAGVALAELLDEPQPHWEIAGGRLGHAIREHRDRFLDKSTFSMDWYYPILGGALRGDAAAARLEESWDTFVVPGMGIRCVSTNAWATGAETCELVMALAAIDDPRARDLFADMQFMRHETGAYWTGYVWTDEVYWPHEQTTYTAAAVILAADELSRATAASAIMRGDTLAPPFAEVALECGCESVLTPTSVGR